MDGLWKAFAESGTIYDYLRYREFSKERETSADIKREVRKNGL